MHLFLVAKFSKVGLLRFVQIELTLGIPPWLRVLQLLKSGAAPCKSLIVR